MSLRQRSGSHGAVATTRMRRQSGSAVQLKHVGATVSSNLSSFPSSPLRKSSTGAESSRLAGEVSNDPSMRRESTSSSSANSVSESALNRSQMMNPWNLFQHLHRDKGWSVHKMALEYRKAKKSNF